MILRLHLLVLALSFADLPLVLGGLFPKKSNVKHIDAKGFQDALKEERAFMTAFVAPWCGHCQKLAPELIRAADGLHPLVPVYAVDCDDSKNRPLCAEQGVKGFPTVKFYPKGRKSAPMEFDGTRTGSSLFYWASGAVPNKIQRSQTGKGIIDIVQKNPGKPKVVLMNKSNKMPLLWKVLSNKYGDKIVFINCRDRKGKVSVELGFEAGEKKHKVLMYGADETEPILYDDIMKFATLSEYFDDVLSGNVDLSRATYDAKQVVFQSRDNEKAAGKSTGKTSEEEEVDEIRIGDAGYGGFNPHEGVDMEELMKLSGGFNPHAAHGDSHGAKKASASDAKKKSESESSTSSDVEATASSAEENSASISETTTPQSGFSGDHPKDEL